MNSPSLTLSLADAGDLDRVERLLAAADLPTDDLRTSPARLFLAEVDGAVVGAGGLEPHGTVGLLRSLVVPEARRGRGYGAAICDQLEGRALDAGVETLYLLTTTAAGFFADRGYEPVDRADAPARIRRTSQFADLCPASATCMRKALR